MPLMQSLLRSVPHQHRTFALGLLVIPVRLFGTILGPLFMGRTFDASCRLWRQDAAGRRLHCLLYDNDDIVFWAIAIGASEHKTISPLSLLAFQVR